MSNVTPPQLDVVRAQLTHAERLAWARCPEPAAAAPKARRWGWDGLGILGGGYATIGAIVMVVRSGDWRWIALPLALVLLGGVAYFVSQRLETRRRCIVQGTVYALTTRRALIVNTYPALSLQSLPIEAVSDIALADRQRHFADLRLSTQSKPAAMIFHGIAEPEEARLELLRVIGDPGAADRQIAASERYMMAMRQIARPAP